MILGSAATHLIKGAAGTFTLGRLRFLPFLAFLGFAGGVCSQGRSSKASGCSYHAEKVRRGFDQSRFLPIATVPLLGMIGEECLADHHVQAGDLASEVGRLIETIFHWIP